MVIAEPDSLGQSWKAVLEPLHDLLISWSNTFYLLRHSNHFPLRTDSERKDHAPVYTLEAFQPKISLGRWKRAPEDLVIYSHSFIREERENYWLNWCSIEGHLLQCVSWITGAWIWNVNRICLVGQTVPWREERSS